MQEQRSRRGPNHDLFYFRLSVHALLAACSEGAATGCWERAVACQEGLPIGRHVPSFDLLFPFPALSRTGPPRFAAFPGFRRAPRATCGSSHMFTVCPRFRPAGFCFSFRNLRAPMLKISALLLVAFLFATHVALPHVSGFCHVIPLSRDVLAGAAAPLSFGFSMCNALAALFRRETIPLLRFNCKHRRVCTANLSFLTENLFSEVSTSQCRDIGCRNFPEVPKVENGPSAAIGSLLLRWSAAPATHCTLGPAALSSLVSACRREWSMSAFLRRCHVLD